MNFHDSETTLLETNSHESYSANGDDDDDKDVRVKASSNETRTSVIAKQQGRPPIVIRRSVVVGCNNNNNSNYSSPRDGGLISPQFPFSTREQSSASKSSLSPHYSSNSSRKVEVEERSECEKDQNPNLVVVGGFPSPPDSIIPSVKRSPFLVADDERKKGLLRRPFSRDSPQPYGQNRVMVTMMREDHINNVRDALSPPAPTSAYDKVSLVNGKLNNGGGDDLDEGKGVLRVLSHNSRTTRTTDGRITTNKIRHDGDEDSSVGVTNPLAVNGSPGSFSSGAELCESLLNKVVEYGLRIRGRNFVRGQNNSGSPPSSELLIKNGLDKPKKDQEGFQQIQNSNESPSSNTDNSLSSRMVLHGYSWSPPVRKDLVKKIASI